MLLHRKGGKDKSTKPSHALCGQLTRVKLRLADIRCLALARSRSLLGVQSPCAMRCTRKKVACQAHEIKFGRVVHDARGEDLSAASRWYRAGNVRGKSEGSVRLNLGFECLR